jgi:hypothetical protein
MRPLSKNEKNILDILATKKGTHLSELLTVIIPGLILDVNKDNNKIKLMTKKEVKEDEIFQEIVYVISFLEYLDSLGYIFACELAHGKTVAGVIGEKIYTDEYTTSSEQFHGWNLPDKYIRNYFWDQIDKFFFPTEELILIQKHKYKDRNQLRYQQSMFVAWVAISISIILGLFSLFIQNHC